jgi:putative tricarboxylic transport membrane protein
MVFKGELLTGAVLAAFGGFVIYEAYALSYTSESGPGPGFFPLWIGIGIVVCSLALLYVYFFRTDGNSEETAPSRSNPTAFGAWLVWRPLSSAASRFCLSLGLPQLF